MVSRRLSIALVLLAAGLQTVLASADASTAPARSAGHSATAPSSEAKGQAPAEQKGPGGSHNGSAHTPSIYKSAELWSTVDVCNPANQPDTIGLRGSMPGDGHPHDTMYMRFRIQYMDPATKQWAFLTKGGDSGYLPIGTAATTRQSGRSFQLAAPTSTPTVGSQQSPTPQQTYQLRGQVSFQWRRASKVVFSTSELTTGDHKSVAGADPKGYSAAICTLT